MDLGLPPDPDGASEGLATLQQILALAPDTKVIVLTGNQDHANAVKAIGMGAYDFHQKPFDPEMLGLVVEESLLPACVAAGKPQSAADPGGLPSVRHYQPRSGYA